MSEWSRYSVDGPAGALEVAVGGEESPRGVAVICHPHPLYGGTLDNKVAYTLARAVETRGLASVRFNFRGVGNSEGAHDGGPGELDDALCAVEHARERFEGLPLMVAGFSFGGWIALHCAQRVNPALLVTVAPALRYDALGPRSRPSCPWYYVHGLADEVIAAEDNRPVLEGMEPPPEQLWLPDVGHFFHGHLTTLRQAVSGVVDARWTELQGSV